MNKDTTMSQGPVISFILATIRPVKIIEYLDNLQKTSDDPQSFEVLIKIDEGDTKLAEVLDAYKDKVSFSYYYFVLPKLKKYFSLHRGYDHSLKHLAPTSRVSGVFTDEVRMLTPGWDTKVKKYIGLYPDDVYRIKSTKKRARNYYNYDECINLGDSYCYFSTSWLYLTGGWGEFWAPDTWHQCLDYHLGLCQSGSDAVFRSMPIFDLEMDGINPGVGLDGKFEAHKVWMNINGCHILESHLGRENFLRLGQRLYGYIDLQQQGITDVTIEENYADKIITVSSTQNPTISYQASFALPELLHDKKTEKWVRDATGKGSWDLAVAEVNHRKPRVMRFDSQQPTLLPSGNEHIELLMESLKDPTQ